MTLFPPDKRLRSLQFWILASFLVMVALTGGGARSDVQSLVVLRPTAALLLGFGLWFITREALGTFRFLLLFSGLIVVAVAVQLIPLPPSIWEALPGRALAVEVGAAAGVAPWRPISLVPYQTWNALYALLIPIAVLVLTAALPRDRRFQLLTLFLLFALVSAVMGLMQIIGPENGPLYLYRITNNGFAVGLFANRNHQAIFVACIFPMLAAFAAAVPRNSTEAHARVRLWLSAAIGILCVPLLLVVGSRLGLFLGVLGLASIPLLYAPPVDHGRSRKRGRILLVYGVGAVAIIGLGMLTFLLSRGVAVDRLLTGNTADDARVPLWKTSVGMITKYFPFGSGYGSFSEVYQVDEPDWALKPTYGNHAHNELLEVALTGGVFGVLLMLAALGAWARASWAVFRVPVRRGRDILFGRLGSVVLLMLGLASVTDYPLRTPFLSSLLSVSAIWLACGAIGASAKPK